MFLFILNKWEKPKMDLLSHWVAIILSLNWFQPTVYESSNWFPSLPIFGKSFKNCSHANRYIAFYNNLNLYFFDNKLHWSFFNMLIGHLHIFFGLFKYHAQFIIRLFVIFFIEFIGVLYVWLPDIWIEIFFSFCGLPIQFLKTTFF